MNRETVHRAPIRDHLTLRDKYKLKLIGRIGNIFRLFRGNEDQVELYQQIRHGDTLPIIGQPSSERIAARRAVNNRP